MARAKSIVTTVRVRDLPLLADIGINPDEIGRRQPLIVAVELTLDAGTIKTLADTVDYRRIVSEAEAMSEIHIPLIETFAQELAGRCITWPSVLRARVSIDKAFALPRGMASVEVVLDGRASIKHDQGDY